jgi:hypothetical protein
MRKIEAEWFEKDTKELPEDPAYGLIKTKTRWVRISSSFAFLHFHGSVLSDCLLPMMEYQELITLPLPVRQPQPNGRSGSIPTTYGVKAVPPRV